MGISEQNDTFRLGNNSSNVVLNRSAKMSSIVANVVNAKTTMIMMNNHLQWNDHIFWSNYVMYSDPTRVNDAFWGEVKFDIIIQQFLSHCREDEEHFDTKMNHVACSIIKLWTFELRPVENPNLITNQWEIHLNKASK